MDEKYRLKITQNIDFIATNISSVSRLLNLLLQESVLSQVEVDTIKSYREKYEIGTELGKTICKKHSRAFPVFLRCLEESENEDIAQKLMSHPVPKKMTQCILKNLDFIASNISSLPKLTNLLVENSVISQGEMEAIKSHNTDYEVATELAIVVSKKDDTKFSSFIKCLEESGNKVVAERMMTSKIGRDTSGDVFGSIEVANGHKHGKPIKANEIGQLLSAAKEVSEQIWFGFTAPNMIYVGRDEETAILQKYWNDCLTKKTLSFVSVTGLGGVGKSELATNFAKWFYETVQGHCVWIVAESDQSMVDSFTNLAEELKISLNDDVGKEKEFLKVVEEVYKKLFGEKLLLVFDNLENYTHEALKLLIRFSSKKPPTVLKPFVITTSRLVEAKKHFGTQCNPIDLQVLSKPSAMEFFNTSLNINEPVDGSINEQEPFDCSINEPEPLLISINELIEKLCRRLQFFPLAMQQASAYIHERMLYCTVHDAISNYLTQIEIQTKVLLDYKLAEYEAMDDISKTTFLTWRITIAKLKGSKDGGDKALNTINVISFLSPDSIPTQMVKSILQNIGQVSNTVNIDNLCELIRRYSMINFVGEKLVSVHRLVQEVTRIELGEKGKFFSLLKEIANCMMAMLNEKKVALKEVVHVQVVWQHVSKKNEMIKDHGGLPSKICSKLCSSGKYRESLNFGSESRNSMESVLGRNDRWTLKINYWIGATLNELGDYLKALEILKNVYKTQKKIFGEIDDDFLNTAFELGNVHFLLNDYNAAMNFYKYALNKRERFYGKEHPHVGDIKNSMTVVLMQQNKPVESQRIYEEFLGAQEQSSAVEDPIVLTGNYMLSARAKFNQKDYNGALKEFTKALKLQERDLELDHPDIINTKYFIGMTYGYLERFNESLNLLKEVQEKMCKIYGPQHPHATNLEKWIENVGINARLRSSD